MTLVADRPLILTSRQRKVIDLRLRGHGRREIGHQLGIATITVRKHLDTARRVNGLADEVELLIAVDREMRG